ncbi:MAG: type II toxin-antitoxin system HicB family antitoxin [Oscillospiraceae bacterium]|nr:type II toxin-antitoxin system HicB family antitoxin [Oscillospiraceae bacterium]
MSKTFTIAIQKDDDWFVAKCLENNVASQGKSMDEATDNLREALSLYYEK